MREPIYYCHNESRALHFFRRGLQAENAYERGLDAEDSSSLSVRDFYEVDHSRREVNDLVERDPFNVGAILFVSALPLPRSK